MSTLSRHPFFDTQEGLSPSPEHEWVRDYPISCRAMQHKSFLEGMGSAGAASRARRGRGAPLRRANDPQCSLPVVAGAPFSAAKAPGPQAPPEGGAGGAKRYSRCRSGPPAASHSVAKRVSGSEILRRACTRLNVLSKLRATARAADALRNRPGDFPTFFRFCQKVERLLVS